MDTTPAPLSYALRKLSMMLRQIIPLQLTSLALSNVHVGKNEQNFPEQK